MPRIVTALAAALLAVATGVLTAAPAAASAPAAPITSSSTTSSSTTPSSTPSSTASKHAVRTSPYVALGDSYSAGAGVHPQVPGAPATCSRSLQNFAQVIAGRTKPASFTDVTCAGAKTSDFFSAQAPDVAPQLAAVTKNTRLVTMTIGGNDGGAFGSILQGCVTASLAAGSIFGNPCEQQFGSTFTDLVATVTYPNLVAALTAVRERAPRATVAILGYPRVMPDVGNPACYPAMPISMGDVPYVTAWEETLNTAVEKAAAETGVRYVDMWPSSAKRDACRPADRRWIEPINGPVNADPVHPNAAGEAAMAAQALRQLDIGVRRCGHSGGDADDQD